MSITIGVFAYSKDKTNCHYYQCLIISHSPVICTVKLFSYLALILLLCEMWFAFDVLICAVYFAYALPSPLAAGGTVCFHFTMLLQFFVFTEDALN